jgi:hypothetical protein
MKFFPKFKYHPTKEAKIVHSEEQEKKLGKDWVDSPAHYGVETCPGADPDPEILKNAPKEKE